MTREELIDRLKQIGDDAEVEVDGNVDRGGPDAFVVAIISKVFAEQNEAERQARVWSHLRKTFSENDLRNIEFIFARSPDDTEDVRAPARS